MAKKGSLKSAALDETSGEASQAVAEKVEEMTGGLPSSDTEERLARDELEHPLGDADFFDYCTMAFERKGIPIVYYIKKNGKYMTTLSPPCSWDRLRDLWGSGHYSVQCKNQVTNAFMKQKAEFLDELPSQEQASDADSHPFSFAPQAQASSDFAPFLTMMQSQAEQQRIRDENQRVREEDRRREERERDETRRKEDRESRNDLLKSLVPLAAPLLAALLPKKDDKLDTMVDFMKESQREARAQNEKLLERLERAMSDAKKPGMFDDPLAMIKLLNEAKKDGRKEMEDLLDMVEDRAARRAEEMGSGSKEDSTLSLLIKNLGPGLAALMAQGAKPPALPQSEEVELESEGEVVATAQAQPVVPKAKSKEELDQEEIFKALLPFFSEQLIRMQSNHAVDAGGAARESLALLKDKGFSQERVLKLFSKPALFGVLRAYKIPKDFDPWFNKYYDALSVKEAPVVLRKAQTGVTPIKSSSRAPARNHGSESVSVVTPSIAPAGASAFVPAKSGNGSGSEIKPRLGDEIKPGLSSEPGKNAGGHTEVLHPISP